MFRVQFAYLTHRLCCIKRVRYQDATFKDKNSANQLIVPKHLFQITLIIDDSNVFDLVSLRSTLIVFTFIVLKMPEIAKKSYGEKVENEGK